MSTSTGSLAKECLAGRHLFTIESRPFAQQLPAVADFLQPGSQARHRCVLICDPQNFEPFLALLQTRGNDVDELLESQSLILQNSQEFYSPREQINPERMIARLSDAIRKGREDGFSHLRAVGEIPYQDLNQAQAQNLVEYEAQVGALLIGSGLSALCYFRRGQLAPETLIQIMELHQKVAIDGQAYDNPYYKPPEEYFASGSDQTQQMRLDRMLQTLSRLGSGRQALMESERRYRALVEAAPLGILLVQDGKYEYTNRTGAAMLGYDDPEQVKGLDALASISQPSRKTVQHRIENIRRGQGNPPTEIELLRPDGSTLPVESVSVPIPYNGAPAAIILGRDISQERKQQEEQELMLQQRARIRRLQSLGALAGGIAHDFNNLLLSISGNADLIRRQIQPDQATELCLEEVDRSVQRAEKLCRRLLAYSGSGRFFPAPTDLSQFVLSLKASLQQQVSDNRLDLDLAEDLPPVEIDAEQVTDAILQLVANAGEASRPGDRIRIATRLLHCEPEDLPIGTDGEQLLAGDYLCLEVHDQGCGMDPEALEHVFEPFYTTKFTGRGLGLPSVMGIMRGHHGLMRIRSRAKVGTSVELLFPPATQQRRVASSLPEAEHHDNSHDQKPESPSRTVLVADDEPSVLSLVRRMLTRAGYEVCTACDGQEAMEVFSQRRNELAAVILDATMPRKDGITALKELRAMDSDIPIILSSGYTQEEAAGRLEQREHSMFIQKPYRMEQLLKSLADLVGPA